VIHKYPAKMSCAVNNNTYGMCDGFGTCQPLSNYSCPESCERNIIVGCHNYTLNDTHPCTNETLCNYYITLLDCADDLVCLNNNNSNSNSNSNKTIKVRLQKCTYTLDVDPNGTIVTVPFTPLVFDLVNDTTDIGAPFPCPGVNVIQYFDLIADRPHQIPEMDWHEDPRSFLEYSPEVFLEPFGETQVFDNQIPNCFSYWHSPASQPYCSYECQASPNVGLTVLTEAGPIVCDAEMKCTRPIRVMQMMVNLSPNNPPINPPINKTDPGNDDDNHSDGYISSFPMQGLLVVIIANLLLN